MNDCQRQVVEPWKRDKIFTQTCHDLFHCQGIYSIAERYDSKDDVGTISYPHRNSQGQLNSSIYYSKKKRVYCSAIKGIIQFIVSLLQVFRFTSVSVLSFILFVLLCGGLCQFQSQCPWNSPLSDHAKFPTGKFAAITDSLLGGCGFGKIRNQGFFQTRCQNSRHLQSRKAGWAWFVFSSQIQRLGFTAKSLSMMIEMLVKFCRITILPTVYHVPKFTHPDWY